MGIVVYALFIMGHAGYISSSRIAGITIPPSPEVEGRAPESALEL